jgi:tetratricopeptide (TPR) repeat protein
MRKTLLYFFVVIAGCSLKKQKNDGLIRDTLMDYNKFNYASAEQKMQTYIKDYPNDYQGWSFLGTISMQLNKDSLGRIYLNKAIKLNAKDFKALTGLGVLERKDGNYDKAAEFYYKAISIDSTYSRAYGSLVLIELKKGNLSRAVELGEKAQRLEPDDLSMLGNLAIAYHFNKQYDKRDALVKKLTDNGYPYVNNLKFVFNGNADISDFLN